MAYFDPHRKTKLITDAETHGLAVTLKQYDPHPRWWRPVTYRSRTLTDTETRYLQIEKEAKAVEWGMLAIQIYLHSLRDTLEVDTDHKPLLPLFARYKVTALLRIERMRVRLGFDYNLNYVPGKKAKAETNGADCNSRHPEPLTMQDSRAVHQREVTVREEEKLFEKDIRAVVVQAALPDAVSWDEVLEETSQDPELKEHKGAIARGASLNQNSKPFGPTLTQSLPS